MMVGSATRPVAFHELTESNRSVGMSKEKSDPPKSVIERAFDLARSGEYSTIDQIRQRLDVEGYFDAREYLAGRTIRIQLLALLHKEVEVRDDR